MRTYLETYLLRYLWFLLPLLLLLGWWLREMFERKHIATISLSATALVALLLHEGYRENAYTPVPGDVPTIGFGTTSGVKLGDRTNPEKALNVALRDVQGFEGAIKSCVTVPLHQYEYDAYTSLAYNIGSNAFCRSTLVKRLNEEQYTEACNQILRWNQFKGKPLAGLTKRRQEEHKKCLGL
jgi:Phage-related lysozyme (muraminidase)